MDSSWRQIAPCSRGNRFLCLCKKCRTSSDSSISCCTQLSSSFCCYLGLRRVSLPADAHTHISLKSKPRRGTIHITFQGDIAADTSACSFSSPCCNVFGKETVDGLLSKYLYGTAIHIYARIWEAPGIWWDKEPLGRRLFWSSPVHNGKVHSLPQHICSYRSGKDSCIYGHTPSTFSRHYRIPELLCRRL